jgi:hypothetical protein
MQRRVTTLIATGALGLGAAFGLAACGDDEDSDTTENVIEETTDTTVTTETEQTTTEETTTTEPTETESEGGAYGY